MKTFNKVAASLFAFIFIFGLTVKVNAATSVNLATADNFAILAGSAITNTGSSVITGNLGLNPGTVVTGFPPGIVSGTQHVADATAAQAKTDLAAAFGNAAAQIPVSTVASELGGTTKNAGIYNSASGLFQITGTLTLDAQGDPDAVFIFKTASTLTTQNSSIINLVNSAQSCNVFWQVGSFATLGTNSIFKGNILASTSITLTTGANVDGRVLAQSGAVTLDSNIVTIATCLAPPLINILKVPSPLVLSGGPGPVTYNYAVSNIGTTAISNILVTDNKCSPVVYNSGDSNSDSKLDISEVWNYSCTTSLSITTTNIAIVTGDANGYTATDSATATVVVGVAPPPPLINLLKRPNLFVIPLNTTVNYTYTVTNPGVVALSGVNVSDDKCSSISGPVGDTNSNNLLDVSETWTYNCNMNLSATTTNTATAVGSANSLTATDNAIATVVVTLPLLSNTGGLGYVEQSIFMNVLVVILSISLTGWFFIKLQRKIAS